MKKLRHHEALRIYHSELGDQGHEVAYEPKVQDETRSEAAALDWWLDKLDDGVGETPRTKGLLRTYLRIANGDNAVEAGDRLPAMGLRLEPRGRWHMDKYVIAKLYQKGLLAFEAKPQGMFEPAFVLTPAGKEWIEK
ncbi:hypothetical protein U4960_15445 [Altererythrobacter sp. H2]|uniref:hypothetical protein n=1 Tax=Altererythrobacter sp. H2 TaxID=3108391 RepID=UPI002B4C0478|nr:hypothetical protein [Altererythrobacter sp. H2]WRK95648.1 hypothetical protein U4960_15445 [Altererythrobacter sp. H2]